MTSKEFMQKKFKKADGKVQTFASIMKDGDGNIYSYGYHYPLLFSVNGKNYINTSGYSVTTAKHIGWAWGAVNYDAIAVEYEGGMSNFSYIADDLKQEFIERDIQKTINRIQSEMDAKKRKNTQVYQALENDLERAKLQLILAKA